MKLGPGDEAAMQYCTVLLLFSVGPTKNNFVQYLHKYNLMVTY